MMDQNAMAAAAGAICGGAAMGAAGILLYRHGLLIHKAKQVGMAVDTVLINNLQQDVRHLRSEVSIGLSSQERVIGKNAMSLQQHLAELRDRLASVDATRSKMKHLSERVEQLNTVLVAPKSRGIFGELRLENLVKDIMSIGSFEFQPSLADGVRAAFYSFIEE